MGRVVLAGELPPGSTRPPGNLPPAAGTGRLGTGHQHGEFGTGRRRAPGQPGLLDWLDDPRPDRGLHFRATGRPAGRAGDPWRTVGYPRLALEVNAAAARLVSMGVRHHDVVALVLPNGPEFPTAFFAALVAGGTPCPLAVPETLGGAEAYAEHLAVILRVARPALVVTTADLAPAVRAAIAGGGLDTPVHELALTGETVLTGEVVAPPRRAPARLALLQFTSGSTGTPCGVEVSWDNLEANIAMLKAWTAQAGEGGVATWLPFFHDMGLIGTLLGPVVHQVDVQVLRPDQFLRSPLQWLECFHNGRSTAGAAPCFGYAYLARRVRPEQVAGLDLSGWQLAIVGSDRIQPQVLADVARLLAPAGFRPGALAPAYGLAEATLLVTGTEVGVPVAATRVDWAALRFGAPVPVRSAAVAYQAPAGEHPGSWVVSCGRPLPGTRVSIVDDDRQPLPAGHLGEIEVSGPSVAAGHRPSGADTGVRHPPRAGGLGTGDAGFVLGGELYVIGRIAHSVKVRGRNLYVEDVEAAVADGCPLAANAYVVLGGMGQDGPVLAALAETGEPEQLAALCAQLWRLGAEEVDAVVYRVPRGTIRRTSSRKPRRRWMWWQLAEGRLPAEVVHEIRAARGPQ